MQKYNKFGKVLLQNRYWPDNEIEKAPIWCSVDLRDGNQALEKPMGIEEKLKLFHLLVKIGFKQIEIGFPAASQIEYDFVRYLIDNNLIPDDVTIQVLTQARTNLIKKTRESLEGAKNVIVHLYSPISKVQRELVFRKTKKEILHIAINGIKDIKKYFEDFDGNLILQYSPESFTGTELEFSKEVCNAAISEWNPVGSEKMHITLPATVEHSSVNIFADMVEWMNKNLDRRKNVVLGLHNHNDRGTGVAATELGLLAGAQRVEGTLLGNGERTGNADVLVLAMNMFTQGINPGLDFSNISEIKKVIEEVTRIKTHVRHPYAGDFVYTAFSGGHQDAIKKGMDWQKDNPNKSWRVPYLPIDPKDVGENYKEIIRVNSQSGKGGVAYILDNFYNIQLDREEQIRIGKVVQRESERLGRTLENEEIYEIYINNS